MKNPRIPRKPGQPAGSDKHSDLFTDENPKGTIHGLGFKNEDSARKSVAKIKSSGKTHAHKTQAAIAMEQRARTMNKTREANIYRAFIEEQKKITKEKRAGVIDDYIRHAALNYGQAARDIRYFLDHPGSDKIAPRGSIKHGLSSASLRLPSLVSNLYYGTLPPLLHHTEEELAEGRDKSLKEIFLEGYAPWKYGKKSAKEKTAAAKPKRESPKERGRRRLKVVGAVGGATLLGPLIDEGITQAGGHMHRKKESVNYLSPGTALPKDYEAASPKLFKQLKNKRKTVLFPSSKDLQDIFGFSRRGAHFGVADSFGKYKDKLPYIYAPKESMPATLAHEMGHATGLRESKLYNTFDNKARDYIVQSRPGRKIVALAAGPGLLLSGRGKGSKKQERNAALARNIALAAGAAEAPHLIEEARASGRAVRFAPKGDKLKYLKALAPAYTTYLAHLGIPLTAALGAEIARRQYKKKNKRGLKKVAATRARKDVISYLMRLKKKSGKPMVKPSIIKKLRSAPPRKLRDTLGTLRYQFNQGTEEFKTLNQLWMSMSLESMHRGGPPTMTASQLLSPLEYAKREKQLKRFWSGRHKVRPGEEFVPTTGAISTAKGKGSDEFLYRGNKVPDVKKGATDGQNLFFTSRHPDVAAGYAMSPKSFSYTVPDRTVTRFKRPKGVGAEGSYLDPETVTTKGAKKVDLSKVQVKFLSAKSPHEGMVPYADQLQPNGGRVVHPYDVQGERAIMYGKIHPEAKRGGWASNPTYETVLPNTNKIRKHIEKGTKFKVRRVRGPKGEMGYGFTEIK